MIIISLMLNAIGFIYFWQPAAGAQHILPRAYYDEFLC